MLPRAYVYPATRRSTRDLLRRRMSFMPKRSELLAHIQNTNSQYNLPEFEKKLSYKPNRTNLEQRFADPSVQKSIEVDLALLKTYDTLLNDLELYRTHHAQEHDANTFYLLRSIPGVGKILALVLLYENESALAPAHRFIRQLAKPALKPYPWERTKTLHVCHGLAIEERELWKHHFVRTLPMLGR